MHDKGTTHVRIVPPTTDRERELVRILTPQQRLDAILAYATVHALRIGASEAQEQETEEGGNDGGTPRDG
jgi:hypothetical protein